jgi:FkbM family methyltransferase
MGRILNRIYSRYSNPGLITVAHQRKIDFEWIIEAGCHDGTDTLKFLELPNVRKIYAFEPDKVAADKAEDKFKSWGERVEMRRLALMDSSGFIELNTPTGRFGDGNSIVGNFRNKLLDPDSDLRYLKCSTLDTELKNLNGAGLLWLDVEGSAAKVLTGAAKVLTSINLIQIEVELHNSKHRKSDFAKVNRILKKSKFSLIYAPLHPGFFGDAVYIKTELLGIIERLRSVSLSALYLLLHIFIYPLIGKPRR